MGTTSWNCGATTTVTGRDSRPVRVPAASSPPASAPSPDPDPIAVAEVTRSEPPSTTMVFSSSPSHMSTLPARDRSSQWLSTDPKLWLEPSTHGHWQALAHR